MALLTILQEMADVMNAVSSVGIAYPKPPQVAPTDANLPAAIPDSPSGEIVWGASHDDRRHEIVWDLLVKRGDDLSAQFAAIVPVLEDVLAAFRTQQTLGLSYVYECRPTGYEITGISYAGESFLGASITFAVKEKTAVTFS